MKWVPTVIPEWTPGVIFKQLPAKNREGNHGEISEGNAIEILELT